VEIYQDCHPGINSALAKQLAYRVAAARYGTVKSYQELCDWWGAQHKPKTPEEVKDWLYKNKVRGKLLTTQTALGILLQ
jgi:hypothetical protein